MRRNNTQSLGEVLLEYVQAMRISHKLKEVEIINSWEEIVGRNISKATTNIYIQNKIIYIYLNSSIVRNELSMLKDELMKRLNEKVGMIVVEKIVLK